MADLTLAQLNDERSIMRLSFLYSRACDRLDRELLASVYWPDGTDDHGIFKGGAADYVEWVMNLLEGWTSSHHSNTNFIIEIDGDHATGECHWTGFYRMTRDGSPFDQLSAGRYLDRYQKRGGEWRILHRHCLTEWSRGGEVMSDWRANGVLARRDREDPVYSMTR